MAGPNGNGNGRAKRNGKGVAATRPACFRITHAQREQYLELIRDGISSADAAREVDTRLSGRLFRSLRRNDPAFSLAFDQAYEAAGRYRLEDLRHALWDEGINKRTPRVLVWLGDVLTPEGIARRTLHSHVEMTGEVKHVHAGALDELRGELAAVVDLDALRLALPPGEAATG